MNKKRYFNKENYWKVEDVLYNCVSDDYDNLSYTEFRNQLKKDRSSGLLERSGFRVDLRKNILLDVLDEMED